MLQLSITSKGIPEVRSFLGAVQAGAKAASGPIIVLTNKEPYASPIETGRFKSGPRAGQVARKAGGAFMYKRGIDEVRPQIGPALAKAIVSGGGAAAVQAAEKDLNDKAVEAVQKNTPVRSGNLRAGVMPSGRPGIG
jgi:hypothetical protein